ncbi:MAG: NADPH-dependent FMN reductase, partial [Hyphomicrobiales bacterium]|nr:NADPH-dependent FMN reductase [Hyphomicrobiales bacterium]
SNEAWIDKAASRFLAEFEWYAQALAVKRKDGTPY